MNRNFLRDISRFTLIAVLVLSSISIFSSAQSDRDGDGLPDSSDSCPNRGNEGGLGVDETGCPYYDNDWDGVYNRDDQCRNRGDEYGYGIDSNGCPLTAPPADDSPPEATEEPGTDPTGEPDPQQTEEPDPQQTEEPQPYETEEPQYPGRDWIRDADGDGFPDSEDACPWRGNEGGLGTDETGCPYYDADWDGVYDRDDACPWRADEYGFGIDEYGCPLRAPVEVTPEVTPEMTPEMTEEPADADGDGVPDDVDDCPADAGSPENNGCPYSDLTITKVVTGTGADADQDFEIFLNSSNPGVLPPGSIFLSANDGGSTITDLPDILIQIREQNLPDDWEFVSLECTSSTGNTNFNYLQDGIEVQFVITPGDSVSCVFTNEYNDTSSDFDEGTEDWIVLHDGSDIRWEENGGNPGGAICADDLTLGPYWYFRTTYSGDLSSFYGLTLSYDLQPVLLSGSPDSPGDDVVISGGGLTIVYRTGVVPPVDGTWTQFNIPFTEGGWYIQGTNTLATMADIQTVLAAVSTFDIAGEYVNGNDTACIDNVVIE